MAAELPKLNAVQTAWRRFNTSGRNVTISAGLSAVGGIVNHPLETAFFVGAKTMAERMPSNNIVGLSLIYLAILAILDGYALKKTKGISFNLWSSGLYQFSRNIPVSVFLGTLINSFFGVAANPVETLWTGPAVLFSGDEKMLMSAVSAKIVSSLLISVASTALIVSSSSRKNLNTIGKMRRSARKWRSKLKNGS